MKIDPISKVLDTDDPLDIRKDNVFKAVFTKNTPESLNALSKLVSALIEKEISVVSILANEPPPSNIHDRQIRFDINCRTKENELINVEMCLNPAAFEPVRLEFYVSRLFVGQDIKGSDKTYNDLKQTYQIAVLANIKFFDNEHFLHSFEYYDPKNEVSLNGKTQIITLELSKLDSIVEKPTGDMSVSEKWAVYFEYLTNKEKRDKINEILSNEEGIAMASQVLMTISRDEEERARLMRDEKILLDYQSGLVHAKREGKAEKSLEVARNALAKGYTPEAICDLTGLDPETIASL